MTDPTTTTITEYALARALLALQAEVERLRGERDHFREAWAAAQVRLDCSEIERLREECHTLRLWAEEAARAENANAEDAKRERAAVVAWLRERARPTDGYHDISVRKSVLLEASDEIERGEHRREEER